MNVLELFAGLRGWSDPWKERGHQVLTLDYEPRFESDYSADLLEWDAAELPWRPDVILASPPCEKFSVLTIGRAWLPGYIPRHEGTRTAIRLVERTVALIEELQPTFWVIENPVGMLRKLSLVPFERRTVNYCQYGTPYMKPTDLWGGFPPSWTPRPRCRNNAPCHVSSPRGSTTGIQGDGAAVVPPPDGTRVPVNEPARRGFRGGMIEEMRALGSQSQARKDLAAQRAIIPPELSADLCIAAERDLANGLRAADFTGRLWA